MPALIEQGREWVAGGGEDALLAEAAALVAEATDGAEHFSETLAGATDTLPARAAPAPRDRRPPRPARRAPRMVTGR